MGALIKRVLGTLLIVAGLALALCGGWLWSHLGSDGRAAFSATPNASTVVLGPDVINRMDRPVTITAEGKGGIWLGKAVPSDATAALGEGGHDRITGVDWQDWTLTRRSVGSGPTSALDKALVWQETATGERRLTATVDQAKAPQTYVLSSTDGTPLTRVELSVTDKGWFSWALWPVVAGVVLTLLGIALWLWSLRRRRRDAQEADDDPVVVTDPDLAVERDVTSPEPTRVLPAGERGATAAGATAAAGSSEPTEPLPAAGSDGATAARHTDQADVREENR